MKPRETDTDTTPSSAHISMQQYRESCSKTRLAGSGVAVQPPLPPWSKPSHRRFGRARPTATVARGNGSSRMWRPSPTSVRPGAPTTWDSAPQPSGRPGSSRAAEARECGADVVREEVLAAEGVEDRLQRINGGLGPADGHLKVRGYMCLLITEGGAVAEQRGVTSEGPRTGVAVWRRGYSWGVTVALRGFDYRWAVKCDVVGW